MPTLFYRPSIQLAFFLWCCWASCSKARHPAVTSKVSVISSRGSIRSLPFAAVRDLRGGSTAPAAKDENEGDDTSVSDITRHPDFAALQAYRMEQQILMQLRATYLSEALVKRGIPLPSVEKVATPDGAKPPEPIDWDCALSTKQDPKMCLFTFDTEPNTKVIGPAGASNEWISVRALNRLRRSDPTKVESMWHMKYAILDSWFGSESQYSVLQHVGLPGFLLNELLQGYRLHLSVGLALCFATILLMPILEYMANRIVVSGFLWSRWVSWHRFVHAALPLKLLLGQIAFKALSKVFVALVSVAKDVLVELESDILEQSIPLTVGVPDMIPPGKKVASEDIAAAVDELELAFDDEDADSEEEDSDLE